MDFRLASLSQFTEKVRPALVEKVGGEAAYQSALAARRAEGSLLSRSLSNLGTAVERAALPIAGLAAGAAILSAVSGAPARQKEREQTAVAALGGKSISELTRQELVDVGLERYADYGVQPVGASSVFQGAFPSTALAALQGVPVETVVVEGHPVLGNATESPARADSGFWGWLGRWTEKALDSPVIAAALLGTGVAVGGIGAGVGAAVGGVGAGLGAGYLGEQVEDLTEQGLTFYGLPAAGAAGAATGAMALPPDMLLDLI